MRVKPTLHVNLHTAEGRGFFQLGLDEFSRLEIEFMLKMFKLADDGVEFGVIVREDGRHMMHFIVGKKPEAKNGLAQG